MWDQQVRAITGGLTILSPAKGQWLSPDGQLFAERMIPVRIACDEEAMHSIAQLTLRHYEQQAVLYYRVFIRHAAH